MGRQVQLLCIMCNNSQGGEEENIPNEAKYERRAETNKPDHVAERSRTNIFCVQSSILNHQNERAQKQKKNKQTKQLGAFLCLSSLESFLVCWMALYVEKHIPSSQNDIMLDACALSNGSTPAIS